MLKNVNLPNEDIVEIVFTMDEEDRLTKDMIEQVTFARRFMDVYNITLYQPIYISTVISTIRSASQHVKFLFLSLDVEIYTHI